MAHISVSTDRTETRVVPEESYSPFWKNCGKRLGAFDPNLVVSEIEVGQRAAELQVERQQLRVRRLQAPLREICLCLVRLDATQRLDLAVLLCGRDNCCCAVPNVVFEQVDRGQRGADQTVKKRAEEGKWGS